MARNGKLGKLKGILKRWNSSVARTSSGGSEPKTDRSSSADVDTWQTFHDDAEVPSGHHPVYVGKSRRRYVISSHVLDHPLFQNLLESSSPAVVGCEVVLFEHLLWMLENGDPKPDSLVELVDYYAC